VALHIKIGRTLTLEQRSAVLAHLFGCGPLNHIA